MNAQGHSQIYGVGGYLPDQVVSSVSLLDEIESEKRFGIPNTWLDETLGIIERRYAPAGTQPSDLALEAATLAVEESSIDPGKIGLVVYCAIERDQEEPATAHRIQAHLAPNAACWDISSACHGFMDGLSTADALIGTGAIEYALVVTGETSSRACRETLNLLKNMKAADTDRVKGALGFLSLGDGGGAMVLGPKEGIAGIQYHCSHSAGKLRNLCHYRYAGNQDDSFSCHMNMPRISSHIILAHRSYINDTYHKLGWTSDDIDSFMTHQVGVVPLKLALEHAGISKDKATHTLERYGNLTSATIPVNFWQNRPSTGDKVLMMGAGSGTSISQWGYLA